MPKIPLLHLPPSPLSIMYGGGPPHRRFELGPEIIGLLGVFAGVIVVATYQCLVNNCCCSQRRIQNANTQQQQQQQQQQNEQQRQGIQINPNIRRPPTSNNPPPAHLIPIFKYTKECKEGICAVCLCEFRDGETIRVLPECMHLFHAGCIDMWLNSHSNCPLCRTDIVPPRHVVLSMPPPQHVVLSMPHFSGGDI